MCTFEGQVSISYIVQQPYLVISAITIILLGSDAQFVNANVLGAIYNLGSDSLHIAIYRIYKICPTILQEASRYKLDSQAKL